jgi:hypothetical protein
MIDSGFDPEVIPLITRVAQLARIKDSARVVNQDGQIFTVREKFELDMVEVIKTAHWMADDDPTRLKGMKKIRQLAGKLEEALQDGNLSRRLPFSGVKAVTNLVNELCELERLKKHGRPKKWAERIRKQFVNDLLDAVHDAGGDLGLDSRNGSGKLVQAIAELRPYLPDEFRHGLSASTLKNIKAARPKNRKK